MAVWFEVFCLYRAYHEHSLIMTSNIINYIGAFCPEQVLSAYIQAKNLQACFKENQCLITNNGWTFSSVLASVVYCIARPLFNVEVQ